MEIIIMFRRAIWPQHAIREEQSKIFLFYIVENKNKIYWILDVRTIE